MAQFNITHGVNTSPPYTISVKKAGDNIERWVSGGTQGNGIVIFTHDTSGNATYNIIVSKPDCVQATASFSLNCAVPSPTPTVMPSPVPSSPVPSPVSCNLSITNVGMSCVSQNNGTLTVSVNNPSMDTLEYNIDGYGLPWQSSNIFTSITNGGNYTVRVRKTNNVNCQAFVNNVFVDCQVTTPPTTSPVATTCNLSITNVGVNCVSANNGTLTVFVNNPDNYSLEYNIDGFGLPWQSSNIFAGITNGGAYTLRVRNANNTSCTAFKNDVFVNCQSIPTPITQNPVPTPTPVSPVPTPVSPVPSPVNQPPTVVPSNPPVNCNPITNLTIYGNRTITANSQNSYTISYLGDEPYTYEWSISGQGTNVIGANNASFVTFQMGNSNGTISLTITGCGGSYFFDFPYIIDSSPVPSPVPSSGLQSTIGSANIDFVYPNNGGDTYDFRIYQSTVGVSNNGDYVQISTNNTLRHIPNTANSVTTSYLIAGYSASLNNNQRFYRFGINTNLLKTDFPSINEFTFDVYGGRKNNSQNTSINVRVASKRQNYIDVSPINGVDFGVAISETDVTPYTSKICAAINTYEKIGYITYNVSANTFVYTNISNLICNPV